MITRIDNIPEQEDYYPIVFNRINKMIDKINEIIDHLNEVHEKGGHVIYPEPRWSEPAFYPKKEDDFVMCGQCRKTIKRSEATYRHGFHYCKGKCTLDNRY